MTMFGLFDFGANGWIRTTAPSLSAIVFSAHTHTSVPVLVGFIIGYSHCYISVLWVANIVPMLCDVFKSFGNIFGYHISTTKPFAFANCLTVIAFYLPYFNSAQASRISVWAKSVINWFALYRATSVSPWSTVADVSPCAIRYSFMYLITNSSTSVESAISIFSFAFSFTSTVSVFDDVLLEVSLILTSSFGGFLMMFADNSAGVLSIDISSFSSFVGISLTCSVLISLTVDWFYI